MEENKELLEKIAKQNEEILKNQERILSNQKKDKKDPFVEMQEAYYSTQRSGLT